MLGSLITISTGVLLLANRKRIVTQMRKSTGFALGLAFGVFMLIGVATHLLLGGIVP